MQKLLYGFFIITILFFTTSCGSSSQLTKLKREFNQYPEYTIILQDMKQEGNFFPDYYHRYKTVYAQKLSNSDSLAYNTELTDWHKVGKKEFQKYQPYLGMVLASRGPEGKESDDRYPPGYQYVGNPRYGQWRTGSGGSSFWEFYGKFAFMSSMFNLFSGRRIYRNDYDSYRGYRNSRRPFFGTRNQYGTSGSYTKKSNPTFFKRRQIKERQRRQSFSEKVRRRTRRSNMSGARRRSGGFGK